MKKKSVSVLVSVICLISFITLIWINPHTIYAEASDLSFIEDITNTYAIGGDESGRLNNTDNEEISEQADLGSLTVTDGLDGSSSGEDPDELGETPDSLINPGGEPDMAIISFDFADLDPPVTGAIDEDAKTIDLTVPYETDVTFLVPAVTHTRASISPESDVAQDFTDPVIYKVTAEDGSSQEYTVTVTLEDAPPVTRFLSSLALYGDSILPTAGSGKALNYDGVNDYIAIPYTTSTRLAGNMDYTISMWFLPLENKSMNLFAQNAYRGQQEAFLRIADGKINTGLSKQSSKWQRNYGEIPVEFGQWNHVAMTKEGDNLRTYVNGVLDINVALEDVILAAAQPTAIASFGCYGTYFFDGYLDEIQLWNAALPQNLINEWMYSGVDANHPNYDNLVLYYKLNEGAGNSSVSDAKGSYDGTMTNMSETAWVDSNIKSWITNEDEQVSGYLFGSYTGDISGFTYEIADSGTKGIAVIGTGNEFTYTPDPNENGSDVFTYQVLDSEGNYSDTQSVSIIINAVNDAPGRPGTFASPAAGESFLAGDSMPVAWEESTDPEGDTITYTVDFYDGSSWNESVYSGTAASFTFTAPTGVYTTLAKFRVKASDGSLSSGFRESDEFTIVPAQYTLTYRAGANGSISGTSTQTVNHGSSGTEVTAVPGTGYHFVKWSDNQTEASRTDSNVTQNIDVTATFAINEYTVTFVNWDDTVLKTETVNYGSAATAPADPIRPADAQYTYTFTGWDKGFDNITGDLTVKATYSTELNSYTVTFVNWDDTVLKTETVNYGSAAAAPADPIRPADAQYTYTFAGWDKGFDNITGDLTVKASFSTELNSYTVTFVNWDDTVLKTETVNYGSAATAPADPSREGHTFTGWNLAYDNVTADLTITALYKINSYNLIYDGNDETKGTTPVTIGYEYGSTVTVAGNPGSLGKIAFTFVGWNTKADGSGISYREGSTFLMGAADVTLYAKWAAKNSGDSPSGHLPQTSAFNYVPVSVGGQIHQQAAAAVTQTRDGRTFTTVALDVQRMTGAVNASELGSNVTIPMASYETDAVITELNGELVKTMEDKQAVLEIRTATATYILPAQQINIRAVSPQLGQYVKPSDIKVSIVITKSSAETVKIVENAASNGNFSIVVPPIDFTVMCIYGNRTINVSEFSQYVERIVEIPDDVDPQKITTGVTVEPDGVVRHVPTKIVVMDGKYYARINSLTDSTYSVIWNPIDFNDSAVHWAKEAINDMGSRLVISGTGNEMFEPDRDITRAEFAAIIVRALGIKPGMEQAMFSDVHAGDWYSSFVIAASEYKIISGYGDGKFVPNDKITREQAMVMIARAMNITELKVEFAPGEVEKLLASYNDADKIVDYAGNSIAACIKAGIAAGKKGMLLAPKDNITRAEAAVIIQGLLHKSNLI